MSRLSGQTSVATNADILMNSPFDTRSWTPYYSGLTDGTIPQPYKGMLVSVYNDTVPNRNGLYFCTDVGGSGVITTLSTTWEKLGAGTGTLTGGTVSSDNKISGGTSSGYTTYFGQVRAATGGTYSNGTISLSGTGTLGTITGFNVLSGSGVSGLSFNQATYDLTITDNNNVNYTRNLSILASDLRVTGGTYNPSNGIATFVNNSGGTFPVSGFLTGYTDFYTTGSTYNSTTGILSFRRTDTQLAYSATGFNYVTGGSYSNGTLTLITNTGQTLNVTGFNISSTFTGGTVTGATNFTNGLTANTISATTYQNLPLDRATTGGTYNASAAQLRLFDNYNIAINIFGITQLTGGTYSNGTATFTNSTGGTFTVTGIASQFTGGTVTGGTNFTGGLTANTISATTYFNLPTDIRVTGGTYSLGTITFTNNTGGTFTVTGLNTSTTFTGGTVTGSTNFTNGLTANTISATTYFNLPTDIRVTGGTYSSGTATFTNNTGGTFTVTGFNVLSGSGVSGLSFNQATYDLTITTNNNNTYTRNLSILASDLRVTGGTYNPSNGIATFVNNSGGTFPVSGFLTGYTDFYTTGSTYTPTNGIISFNRTDLQPAYSATGFNYVTGGTFNSGTLSLVTNTGQTVNITGFGTGSAIITGGTDNFITKWSGSSALTISQIYDNGINVGIGVTGVSLTNKLTVSASTNPVKLIGIQQSAQTQSTSKFLMIDDNGVVFWNNVTPTTGISIYLSARTNSGQIDFIPTGTSANYRSVNYNYQLRKTTNQTIRSGTLQAVWSSGATGGVNYSDMGPLQFLDGGDSINYIAVSGVTGGITVDISVSTGTWEFKAYKVLL